MDTNPYSSPGAASTFAGTPSAIVHGPAIALVVVSIISIACLCLALCVDVFLLASESAARVQHPALGVSEQTKIGVRMAWSGVILASNVVTLIGAFKMRALRNHGLAKYGAILAVIPCVGPCCVLGIPFGVWALVALNKPGVKDAFQ